jgi:HSP20 family molecular chaperone IbpA
MKSIEEKKVRRVWVPACPECPSSCSDDESDISLQFEIPGVNKDKINLQVVKDKLRLIAKRSDLEYYSEYEFECETIPEKVKAHYDNGELTVHIPQVCPDPFKDGKSIMVE